MISMIVWVEVHNAMVCPAKTAKKQQVKTMTMQVYTALKIWFRNFYVAHAFVVCNDYDSVCVMCLKYTIIIYFEHITHTQIISSI